MKLILGDCLDKMRELPSGAIDAVICDPPYGIDFQSARRTERTQFKPKIANDKRPFIWWLQDAFRITKDGGGLLCFCRWDVQEDFRRAIELAGYAIKSQVIWDRVVHGMGDLKASFGPQHDVIWFATKGKFAFPGKRPKSVIRSPRLSGDQLVHPNEKPVELMEQLLAAIVPLGGVVVDPFLGSGATLQAAKRLGMTGIGIEIDERYFEIARKRIAETPAPANAPQTSFDLEGA